MLESRKKFKSKEWQVMNSSLAKICNDEVTYEQCRKYACEDISSKLTHIVQDTKSFIVEIPKGTDFHFIGRVDTTSSYNNPISYYNAFEERNFASFSTINKRNISHYRGRIFFVYNILPDDIVHIFPMDCDTEMYAEAEEELTWLPSLWLTLQDLEDITLELEVYNQITCKTKRKGQILKPFAVIAFNEIDEEIKKVAEQFGIGCIIIHPDDNVINYDSDLLYDCFQLNSISPKMEKRYGISLEGMLYLD